MDFVMDIEDLGGYPHISSCHTFSLEQRHLER